MAASAPARLYQALVDGDPARAIAVIERARESGLTQTKLLDTVFVPAMSRLGESWASGAIDEYTFTKAAATAEQIGSFVTPATAARDTGITVLLGNMHHDLHGIDRAITAAALKESGHRVIDLGADVLPSQFLQRAEETGARIVMVFAQSVATAASVNRISEMFEAAERPVALLVSGGPFWTDARLAKAVGANGVFKGAQQALVMVDKAAQKLGGLS